MPPNNNLHDEPLVVIVLGWFLAIVVLCMLASAIGSTLILAFGSIFVSLAATWAIYRSAR